MQGVFGIIEGQSEEACISSQRFKNATIRFFGKSIHHFTTFEMSLVYYKDKHVTPYGTSEEWQQENYQNIKEFYYIDKLKPESIN